MIQRNVDWGVQEEMQMAVALVLGGGRGTRLYPLTSERAKPAVPFGGRYRLIDIPLSNCIHSGINRIFVLTQFNSASLNRHISSTYTFDAFGGGFVEILAAEQTREYGDWFQGTADAVRKHMRHFRNMRITHYLILSGDQLYGMDYRQLMTTHISQEADITVAVLPVTKEAARGFGVLKVDEEGRIREFVEKPRAEEEFTNLITPPDVLAKYGLADLDKRQYLASMGVYVIKADVLETILNERRDWIDFGKDVIPKSLKSHRVFSHPFLGFWEDIGTVRSYYEVSLQLVRPDPPFEFKSPEHEVYTHPRHLPGARVNNSTIKDCFLCEGTCVHSRLVENSIIGIRSILQPESEIRNSIIMGSDYYEYECPTPKAIPVGIGRGSRITQAIIDKNARIGQNVVIEGADHLHDADGDGWSIRDGIVIVLKNAIIPDGTKIGAAAEATAK